jgi:hypothetical protein
MPVKVPIRGSYALLSRIKGALTPDRLPLLIAIDGADSSGKSSLASWLAWQLGMPAVQLDLYLSCLRPIQWRVDDLARVIAQRIDTRRPVIIDGVLVLAALDQIKRKADFLVFVRGGHEGSALAPQLADYQLLQKPLDRANVTIAGYGDRSTSRRPEQLLIPAPNTATSLSTPGSNTAGVNVNLDARARRT